MEDTMVRELTPDEMDQVSGGKENNSGGYARKPKAKPGCDIYKIAPQDTLVRIAGKKRTTVDRILAVNPGLCSHLLRAGYYIYVPL